MNVSNLMMLLMPVIEISDSNWVVMLYHIIWGLDGYSLTRSSLARANLLRSCGGSNYEGHRTGYYKFACLEIALQREGMGVMIVTSTERRSTSTYGGVSSVLVCPYGRLIAHGPSQRECPPEKDITGSQAAALKPVMALKKDLNSPSQGK